MSGAVAWKKRSLMAPYSRTTPEDLCRWLCMCVNELRKEDGSEYNPRSICQLISLRASYIQCNRDTPRGACLARDRIEATVVSDGLSRTLAATCQTWPSLLDACLSSVMGLLLRVRSHTACALPFCPFSNKCMQTLHVSTPTLSVDRPL